ncbi:uncharacterized protein LOC135541941 isoform X5 [Oncorhynchus masou masou]|uniref:uncharacterized protein LOC135541941 isoform X5 n=1 Tax=Oncorhynchus masou masou TaxID=90313 RepID=UPI003182DE40
MMRHGCAQAILTFLVILISCPMESDCEEDSYNSILQDSPYYLSSDLTHFKRYRDIHDDSFVGLMGRRSAGVNELPSQRRDMDDVFVGLLGRRSSGSAIPQPWREEVYPQPRGGILIKKGRLRQIRTRCIGSRVVPFILPNTAQQTALRQTVYTSFIRSYLIFH